LHFYRIRKEQHHFWLTALKSWCSFWSPKITKVDYEAAVKSAVKSFQTPLLLAVTLILISFCGDKYKLFDLTVEYKESEQVQITCRICAALAHLLINKAEEVRLMIMENIPQNGKLTLFIDYYVQQWMENQNVPIEMWNTNKHRLRNNNAVEGWNSKLSSIIGKQQPNIFLLVQRLNGEADFVPWQVKSKESGQSD
jgi:hypothetical protein